jgi:porin
MSLFNYWWKYFLAYPATLIGILAISLPTLAQETLKLEEFNNNWLETIEIPNNFDGVVFSATDGVEEIVKKTERNKFKFKSNKLKKSKVETNYGLKQINSVNQLSDVQPTDWAYEALKNLVETYGVIQGYPNGTFKGNRAMTRYEFAAALNAALERITQLVNEGNAVTKDDLMTLQKLQEDFTKELTALKGRVSTLESRTALMEMLQFSTTTKLQGQAVFALNSGGQNGSGQDPNTIFFGRVRLNLNTSFTGKDRLLTQIQAFTSLGTTRISGSPGLGFDAADTLADKSSGLFYSAGSPGFANGFELNRLSYTFPVGDDIKIAFFPRGFATDYIDSNKYASRQGDRVDNFSTESLTNNILLFALDNPSAGAAVTWRPGQGVITLRAVYTAQDATVPFPTGIVTGNDPNLPPTSITDVYTNPNGDKRGGLFGDPYIGYVEAEFAPSDSFTLRLQYADGSQGGSQFSTLGVNFDLTLSPQFGAFGRFGYSPEFLPIPIPGIKPVYWQFGLAFNDLINEGDMAGVAVAQPLIFQHPLVNGTQTNFEAFYNFKVNDSIRVTPLVQVIVDPLDRSDKGTIFTGTLRTVFSF